MRQGANTRPLGVRGRGARLGAVVAVAALLGYGSALGSDDLFPFGPMTQYSFRIDPDGEIRTLWVAADLADGTHRRLDLSSSADVGVARAEIEGQLHRFIAEPSRLAALAQGWAELHPERPPLVQVTVGQDVVVLAAGAPAGRRTDVFVSWDVERGGE